MSPAAITTSMLSPFSSGQLLWRFAAGGTPLERPAVLDEEIYLPVERAGLLRIDRERGDEVWRNEDGRRFLAAGKNFVYAADRHGRLLVIDRARGTTLSRYDGTRDFVFPIQNDLTDRLLLAANNGLIVCLNDRNQQTPLKMKTVKETRSAPAPWRRQADASRRWRQADGAGWQAEGASRRGEAVGCRRRLHVVARSPDRATRPDHVVARSPDRATRPDRRSPGCRGDSVETFGQSTWHGQETVPQRVAGGIAPRCGTVS